jgi:hypothetical protein
MVVFVTAQPVAGLAQPPGGVQLPAIGAPGRGTLRRVQRMAAIYGESTKNGDTAVTRVHLPARIELRFPVERPEGKRAEN